MKLTQNVQLIQAAIKTHAEVEDHCDFTMRVSSLPKIQLRKVTVGDKVAGQSKADFQACGDERTRQRADCESYDVCRGF